MDLKKRIVIAGGSGFLGIGLANDLIDAGCQVTLLSRHQPKVSGDWIWCQWDARTLGRWQQSLEQADVLINLAGRSVDCIKSAENCDAILRSRVESTRVLGMALSEMKSGPPVWIQMSTAHIYGDPASIHCDETAAYGYGLAPTVAKAWEQEFENALRPDQRGVVLRTSFVIGKDIGVGNGALGRLSFITKLGLGGKVGSGKQGMSWLHQSDFNRIVAMAITDPNLSGVFNTTSPNPVCQVEFMKQLRRALKMPIGLPATQLMVRMGASWVLRTDPELALYGRYILPTRLLEHGFKYRFPDLESALADLCS